MPSLSLAVCKIIKGYFSGHKMEQNRFHLNIRKQFFAEHWNRFLREVVDKRLCSRELPGHGQPAPGGPNCAGSWTR